MIRWLLPLLFLVTSSAFAQEPLARVIGMDDEALTADLLSVLGDSRAQPDNRVAMRRDMRTAQDRALRYLRARGFYAAQVNASLPDDQRPVLEISPGPLFTISAHTVETGSERGNAWATEAISLQPGDPLEARAILDAEAQGLAALTANGWPLAEPGERQISVDHASSSGEIVFNFNAGPFLTFGEIGIETPDWNRAYISRLSPMNSGEPVSRLAIAEYEARLESLQSVANATLTLQPALDGRANIDVQLIPAPRHAIEAELGLSTAEGAGIELAWSRRNLKGRDETLTLSAELASLVQSLTARMTLPHWRILDQNLVLQTGLRNEDTDAFRQNEITGLAEIDRPLNTFLDLRLGVSGDFSRVTDANGERDITTLRLTSALAFDQRDNPLDPRSGVQAAVLVNPGISFGDASATYLQAEARASTYYPINDSFTAAARIRIGSILGADADDLPADLRFYAGGGGSARGFDYQSLTPLGPDNAPAGGLSVTEVNAELRWRGQGRWGAVAFLDSAFAGDNTFTDFGSLRTGAGLGLRYHLDFAPIRLDLATPLNRRRGEDPVQVYISIGQAF